MTGCSVEFSGDDRGGALMEVRDEFIEDVSWFVLEVEDDVSSGAEQFGTLTFCWRLER